MCARARSGPVLVVTTARSALWLVIILGGALLAAGCSGKTDRGHVRGDATPLPQPGAVPANPQPARSEPSKHLLMVVELEPATRVARTLTTRAVELPLPRRRGPKAQRPWRVDVLSPLGAVLFSAPLDDATAVRAELADATGQLSGVTVHKRIAAVPLRLPWLRGAAEVWIFDVSDGQDRELGRVPYPRLEP